MKKLLLRVQLTMVKVIRRIIGWTRYRVFFNIRLIFVAGVVFGRSLAKYAVVDVLMWYLSDTGSNLVISAILSNIQEALSSILNILMGHAADSFVGRFRTIWFSTTAYLGGVMLLWLFNPFDVSWFLVIIILLLAFGTSADLMLEDFLKDMIRQLDKSPNSTEKRVVARSKTWWRIIRACAAVPATFWVTPSSSSGWDRTFFICTITIGISLLFFLPVFRFYHEKKLTTRPSQMVFRVCCAALRKRDLPYSKDPQDYFSSTSSPPSTMPDLSCCRFLAIAARKRSGSLSVQDKEGQEHRGRSADCTLQDVEAVDRLFRMWFIWAAFLVVSLVSATGDTFFIEQYDNLESNRFTPVVIFTIAQGFSASAIEELLSLFKCGFRKNPKLKLGLGILCSIVCCVFAWQLEVQMLKNAGPDGETDISCFWLMPQFCVLGFMEGLSENGSLEFYKSHVDESMKDYGSQYLESVKGLGKLVSILLVLMFSYRQHWFGDSISKRMLDKYYLTLSVVCLVNFVSYCGFVKLAYKDAGIEQRPSDDDDSSGSDQSAGDRICRKFYKAGFSVLKKTVSFPSIGHSGSYSVKDIKQSQELAPRP